MSWATFINFGLFNSAKQTSLISTGDIMLGRSVMTKSLKDNDPNYPFLYVSDVLRNADIVFSNLENPIVDNCPYVNSGFKFCADPKMIEGLKYAGVDIVSLANNHILNYGKEGLSQTKKYLNLKVFIDGGSASGQTFKCMLNSYSYCLTPVDSLAFEITDTLGNKDCVQTTSVYNGASYIGGVCVNPNLKSGVAYPQFSDLAWNYPAGKVIFWNNEETDPVEVYPGFDYSSGNSILSKTFVTETISTQVGKGIYWTPRILSIIFI